MALIDISRSISPATAVWPDDQEAEWTWTTLIGTDAPTVAPLDSSMLPAHHALVEAGIMNLEGLCFDGVSPGTYFLRALPLNLSGGDSAPVRAVLHDSGPE